MATIGGTDLRDIINGTSLADSIFGNGGNDQIAGNAGDDTIRGGAGQDIIDGDAGNDILFADSNEGGEDVLFGGADSDILVSGTGRDHFNGGSGVDAASWQESNFGVVANLATGRATSGGVEDTFTQIENLIGSRFNDTLRGDDARNEIFGADGADKLHGGGGGDHLSGGVGNDTLDGGAGGNSLKGGAGACRQRHAASHRTPQVPLADTLQTVQRRNFYQLCATVTHRGRYYLEHCMAIAVDRDSPSGQREQDGSEVKAVQLEPLIAAGQRVIERRDALEPLRDTGADLYRKATGSN